MTEPRMHPNTQAIAMRQRHRARSDYCQVAQTLEPRSWPQRVFHITRKDDTRQDGPSVKTGWLGNSAMAQDAPTGWLRAVRKPCFGMLLVFSTLHKAGLAGLRLGKRDPTSHSLGRMPAYARVHQSSVYPNRTNRDSHDIYLRLHI